MESVEANQLQLRDSQHAGGDVSESWSWLSPDISEAGATLLNQQLWCWGCDIKRPGGNLLLRFGFKRSRPPRGEAGCSQYSLNLNRHRALRLWGWGVLYCFGETGLFLRRYQFAPQLTATARLPKRAWTPLQIFAPRAPFGNMERVIASFQLVELCMWIDRYERWVRRTCGLGYRIDCLERWGKPMAGPANPMASQWREIGEKVKQKFTK